MGVICGAGMHVCKTRRAHLPGVAKVRILQPCRGPLSAGRATVSVNDPDRRSGCTSGCRIERRKPATCSFLKTDGYQCGSPGASR